MEGSRLIRKAPLLKQFLKLVFEVGGGDRPFGRVGDGLFAEVVEGKGPGRGEAAAPGLVQDKPHQLQCYLRVGLALLQGTSLRAPVYREGRSFRGGRYDAALW
jgi:hypothetical protein